MRLLGIWDFSLSNDELSAFFRLEYTNFAELIQQGVIATDPHPAGIQVFLYYWTKLIGDSPFALRLPFVLASVSSLYFLYLIFRNWFTEQNALIIIAFFSFIEFSSIHGQLARPYAMGILFTSAFVWYWTKVIFEKGSWKDVFLFSLSAVLSAYTHYYAGMVCALIGLVGIFPTLRNDCLKKYVVACVATVVLFLPHLTITISQLSRGPLTSWIPPAESDFVLNHVFQLLNESDILLVLIIAFSALSLMFWREQKIEMKWKAFYAFLFFSLPIIVGYIYSYYFGSALMDRVLYFSSPFFFAFTIGLMPPMLRYGQALPVLGISLIIVLSTCLETTFFQRDYVENFKALSEEIDNLNDKIEKDLHIYSNVNNQSYLNYYSDNIISEMIIAQNFDSAQEIKSFMELVAQADKSEMMLVYACKYQSIEAIEFARKYFPSLRKQEHFFNSGYWHFSKGESERDELWSLSFSHENGDSALLDVGENEEYVNLYSSKLDELKGKLVNTELNFDSEIEGFVLVESVESPDNEVVLWRGHDLMDFYSNNHGTVFSTLRIGSDLPEGSKVKIYLWNQNGAHLKLNEVSIKAFPDEYPQLN